MWIQLLIAVLLLTAGNQESSLPDDQFSLTVVSGTGSVEVEQAKGLIKRAKAFGNCKIKWEQRANVHRLIGIYDEKLASRANGKTTILPVVDKINAQQSIAFYKSKNSKLQIDDLVRISSFLPWDAGSLPKNVEFYRDFEDH